MARLFKALNVHTKFLKALHYSKMIAMLPEADDYSLLIHKRRLQASTLNAWIA